MRDVELFINLDAETNGLALIDIDGIETHVKVDYGFAYYRTVLKPGNYSINVKYLGDNKFNPAETNKAITINQPELKDANITPYVFVEGNGLLVFIDVPPDATGIVLLDINDTETYYYLTGNDNEVLSFETVLPIGTYNLTVGYSGDDYYNYSFVSELIDIVGSLNTDITAKTAVDGTTVTITAEVDSRATGFVEFEILGEKFFEPVVDGVAVFKNIYSAGSYGVNIKYLGDDKFNSTATTDNFIVIEQNPSLKTVIYAPEVSTTYNGNGYLTITIKDENGKFVASRNVFVTINGKTKIVKTNGNGVAKLSTNGLAPKTYIVNIAFEGDGTYAKSNTTSKVVVGKAASKITAKNKVFKKSKKTKKYTITLKSGKKPIKKVKVTLKIKGKTYKAKTNAKGKATFKIKNLKKKGNFKATIKFKGNKYYKAVSKKIKIKVK